MTSCWSSGGRSPFLKSLCLLGIDRNSEKTGVVIFKTSRWEMVGEFFKLVLTSVSLHHVVVLTLV